MYLSSCGTQLANLSTYVQFFLNTFYFIFYFWCWWWSNPTIKKLVPMSLEILSCFEYRWRQYYKYDINSRSKTDYCQKMCFFLLPPGFVLVVCYWNICASLYIKLITDIRVRSKRYTETHCNRRCFWFNIFFLSFFAFDVR